MFRCSRLWLLLVVLPGTGLFCASIIGPEAGLVKWKKNFIISLLITLVHSKHIKRALYYKESNKYLMKTIKEAKRIRLPLGCKGNGKSTYLGTGLFRPRSLVQSLARTLAIFQFKRNYFFAFCSNSST
jgi:hypothetical protein